MKTQLRPVASPRPRGLPVRRTPYPGPRARRVLERMRRVEGAGLRTGGDDAALVVEAASGALLTDPDGNVFVDLYASFAAANLGHTHPEVTAAIQRQAARLTHASSAFGSEVRVDFEEALIESAPRGLERVLLGVTGADANELALKLARTATGRTDIIAFSGGYFGRLAGVNGLNGKVAFRTSLGLRADAHFFPYPYPYRWRWGPAERAGEHVLEMLEEAIDGGASGVAPPAAVFVEPVQGNGGVVIPPPGFLAGLRALCDRHGTLLVFDEIQSGFGRTGRMWAGEHWQVVPDLMTVGKGIGGGVAVSAVLGRPEHMAHWPAGTHTSTFLANALNLAAGRAALQVMQRDRLWQRSAELGARLLETLRADLGDVPTVGEVRGLGLFIGIEIVRDRKSRRPDAERAAIIQRRAFEAGVVVGRGGHRDNVIKLSPPLVIDESTLDAAAAITVDAIRGVS
jgi:diaminobutyrate-2-oxoglutarate transaminase